MLKFVFTLNPVLMTLMVESVITTICIMIKPIFSLNNLTSKFIIIYGLLK